MLFVMNYWKRIKKPENRSTVRKDKFSSKNIFLDSNDEMLKFE